MSPEPIARLTTVDPRERASWEGLADLSSAMPRGWSLAGGNLVRLHLAERGSTSARSTRDIDLILDVRAEPGSIKAVVTALRAAGFRPSGFNPAGHDHRWQRGDGQIDVLVPSFLGPHILDRTHDGLGRLLPTRGAQLAIHRTERVPIHVDDLLLWVNRPDLVGALYGKCSALLVPTDIDKQRHLGDIARLAEVLGPRDRRDMLALRSRERRRLISGLTRAQSGEDVNRRQADHLARLALLLQRSLD